VPDLVAEVTEQCPVGPAHRQAASFALDVVGLRQRDRDQAVVVPRHHLLSCRPIVGEEIEDQAVIGIFAPRLQRQLPAHQRIGRDGSERSGTVPLCRQARQ
jgi:hypothetical protein